MKKLVTLLVSSPMFDAGLIAFSFTVVMWLVGPAGGSDETVAVNFGAGFNTLLWPLLFLSIGLMVAGWVRTLLHRHTRNKSLEDR